LSDTANRRDVRAKPVSLPDLATHPDGAFGVHVPCCATRCGFWDFNTYSLAELGGANPDGWLTAVRAELGLVAVRPGTAPTADTVFVGGGTSIRARQRSACRRARHLRPEPRCRDHHRGDPEPTSPELFDGLVVAGYTRVWLSMQIAPRVLAVLDSGAFTRPGGDRRPRGLGGRFQPPQPRLDLRHAGESDDDLMRSVGAAIGPGTGDISACALVVEDGNRAGPPSSGAHRFVGSTWWWNVKHPNTYAERVATTTLPVSGCERLPYGDLASLLISFRIGKFNTKNISARSCGQPEQNVV
jgi:hypothetical protein